MRQFDFREYCLILVSLVYIMCTLSFKAYGQGTVINTTFYSKSLKMDRAVQIYLPEGYNQQSTIRYPVIYWLHGAGGNSTTSSEIFGVLDELIHGIKISPVIIVKPDGSTNKNPWDGDSWYTNSELFGNFEDYIVFDLVKFIDSAYNTIATKEKRAIMGASMGALGAMRFALKHPDVYSGVVSQSGFPDMTKLSQYWPIILSENGGAPVSSYNPSAGEMTRIVGFSCSGAYSPNVNNPPYFVDFPLDSMGNLIDSVWNRWLLHNCALLARNINQESNLAIYFDCGMQDETLAYPFNTGFADTLDKLGLAYEFQSYNGGHLEQFTKRLPIALHFLDSVMNQMGDEIFATQCFVNRTYARRDIDSILFRTNFSNIDNHPFTPHLIYSKSDNTQTDSISLFDDGQHGDLLLNDGIYGNYIQPKTAEDFFAIRTSTFDNEVNKYYCTPVLSRFTTVGPVVIDSLSITYNSTSNDYKVKLFIHNNSAAVTITKASVKLICYDDYVTSISPDIKYLNNINPGSTASPSPAFSVKYNEAQFPGHFNFKIEVQRYGWTYWKDSMKAVVTGVEEEEIQPLTFKLEQNYPNPFNPATIISYQLAVGSQVTLKVYDVLGNEVATLINEEKPAGTYEVTWNASNLSSGVYFYQLKAGSFVATKKLLLLK